ncbi:MAG: class I SAM-dependent methyltransferase, partial [Defluviitaleaceae bacterium]|nr:class I SAM-dependent methyltransferase [Defluviitaleaceae bacterium]
MATMGLISLDLAAYLGGVMPPLDGELGELYKFASGQGLPIIGEDVLSFLRVIFVLKKPMRVLEIGCCVGFSALLMAREMGANGRVITIDRYPIMIEMAKENFSKLDKHGQIVLLEGDAAVVLPDLARRGEIFDLIFLDAAKGQYNRLWPWCERLLADGGVFLADDVLQGGT